jgi:hypothetical protein
MQNDEEEPPVKVTEQMEYEGEKKLTRSVTSTSL